MLSRLNHRRYALFTMRVRVLPFGVLKDWLGAPAATIEVRDGATVAELLETLRLMRLSANLSAPFSELRGIAVSVNAVYAQATQVLCEDDEVGLLPPVSGGTARAADSACGGVLRVRRMFPQFMGAGND